ncbi:hypothetical protein [Streptomyces sp. NPDC008150]|uniref:hypothetical protein n=1 Tax=Streptomyces sp. NPDC008150 TaxID=3364816 RepID=UPI0036E80ED8
MSAEPVHQDQDRTGASQEAPGSVLPFRRRPRRGVGPQPRKAAAPAPELSPHQQLAALIEAAFNGVDRTLRDDRTATDFRATIGVVRTMVDGARARSIITDQQHTELDAMLEGMLSAPAMLA